MSNLNKPVTSGLLFDDMEIVCVFDGYEPRLAPLVIETIQGIRDEATFTVMFNFLCDQAYESTNWN